MKKELTRKESDPFMTTENGTDSTQPIRDEKVYSHLHEQLPASGFSNTTPFASHIRDSAVKREIQKVVTLKPGHIVQISERASMLEFRKVCYYIILLV